MLERVTGALQLQATQKQINLTVEIAPQTPPLVEADHALLQQAMHNLVENAIKYTASGGTVAVWLRPRQENIVFEVKDTGIGIAPVDMPRMFEKFYRSRQQRGQETVGSGLGLAIVKSIAERHERPGVGRKPVGQGQHLLLHHSLPPGQVIRPLIREFRVS